MRATLLSGVLLLVMEGIAQEWCTSGARWRTRTAGFQSVVFSDMTCLGDTLVDGYQAYRIRTISSGYNGPIPISEETISYIVVDQDVLWYRNSTGVLDTLTWFGAEVGDHWKFGPTVGGTADTLRANVTAVGTRSFGGVPLRYVVVDQVGGVWEPGADTTYERMGPLLSGWIDPILCYGSMEATCPELLCYQDDEIEWIAPGSSLELCNTPLGVGTWLGDLSQAFTLSPNPSEGPLRMNISDPNWRTARITIFDMQGREVANATLLEDTPELDLRELPAGCYVVQASDAQGERLTANWMKR